MTQDRIEQAARECLDEARFDGPSLMVRAEARQRAVEAIAALIRREREDAARMERERLQLAELDAEQRRMCAHCYDAGKTPPHTREQAEENAPVICHNPITWPIADTGEYDVDCGCAPVPCEHCDKGRVLMLQDEIYRLQLRLTACGKRTVGGFLSDSIDNLRVNPRAEAERGPQ
jgi:hypothetical protein